MRRILLGCVMVLAMGASASPGALAQTPPDTYGLWAVSDQTSPLDGTPNFKAAVDADNTVSASRGGPKKPALALFCDHQGLALNIDWPAKLDVDSRYEDTALLIWKLDDGPLKKIGLGFGKKALVANGAGALRLLRLWEGGKVLAVRVPDRFGGQDATFHIDGLSGVLAHIARTGCGPTARAG